jgi:hypothetical protein
MKVYVLIHTCIGTKLVILVDTESHINGEKNIDCWQSKALLAPNH